MPGQICLRLLYERAHTPKAYAYKQDFLAYIFVKVVFSVWLQAQHRKFDIYANETQNNGIRTIKTLVKITNPFLNV